MPWLVIHPLLPLILLAGVGTQALWDARDGGGRRGWCSLVAAVAFVGSTAVAVRAAYFRAADAARAARAGAVVGRRARDAVERSLRLDTADRRTTGKPLGLAVDSWGGTGWPWSWYLRDVPPATTT